MKFLKEKNLKILILMSCILFIFLFTIDLNQTNHFLSKNKLTLFEKERPQSSYAAVWIPNGTEITTESNSQGDPRICSDGAGGAIITWNDYRNGNWDIYAQRINSTGDVQWISNGTVVSNASSNQRSPQICSDGAGGAIITWNDYRNGNDDIYIQRINSTGDVQWISNGTVICNASNMQLSPDICSGGVGGAIIAWQDYRNSGTTGYDIYIQRINSSGDVQWISNGTVICNASNDQSKPQIYSDGAEGAIITWQDFRNGNSDIYAQRINSTGDVQWTNNGTVICNASNHQFNPVICSDDAGGAIIVWEDNKNSGTTGYDIFIQRINSTGSILWTNNGTVICIASNDQRHPEIGSDGAGGAIVSWYDYRSDSNFDIYTQRINTTGEVQWTTNGIFISSPYTGEEEYAPICSDGANGAIITWPDYRNSATTNRDIYAQRVDSNGVIKWTSNQLVICSEINDQGTPQICSDGAGGAIFAWADRRRPSNYDIYTQRIKNEIPTSNHPGFKSTTVGSSETFNWTLYDDSDGGEYRVVANNTEGNFYTWVNWTPWTNNTPIIIPINSTELGVYNYTIEYNDDQYQYGIPDSVIVTINPIVDFVPPSIILQLPLNNTYWAEPPLIKLSAFDANLDKIWYNISGIQINEFLQNDTAEYLNDTIWDNIPQGMFEINFYANDSNGNLNDTFIFTLYKDSIVPDITIHSVFNDTYWAESPLIKLSAFDANLDKIWYNVSGIPIDEFLQNDTNEYLNDSIWGNIPQGSFELNFYANDSAGNINSSFTFILYKDTNAPNIIVNSPLNNTYWVESPLIKISVVDSNLEEIWYTVSSNPLKIFLQNNTEGYLNNILWANLPPGPFEITFYANDSAGNIGYKNISLNKHVGMWLLSPFTIDDLGSGDYTWLEASIKGWCKGSGTSSDPYVIENIIIDGENSGSCIEIKNSNEFVVINNSIFTNSGDGMTDAGIELFSSINIELLDDNCSNNNAYGIYLSNCQYILIEGCTIKNNAKSGTMLYESDNNIIRNNNNTINSNTEYGIYLSVSHYNQISGNTINDNLIGIYIFGSNYNTITNNDLLGNTQETVLLEGNCIGNSFSGNILPISDGGIQFPSELLILIIAIGTVAALGITGTVVWKKRRSVPKKVKKVKKSALISQAGDLKEYNVFLSYSTKDSEYFQLPKIVKSLEQYPEISKVLYWEVDSGQNIVEYMEETLKNTNVFVLFCSENSLNSKAVKDEWQSAFQIRKERALKILPVFEDQQYIPRLLLQMLNVEYTKNDFKEFIQNLYEEILR